MAELTIRPEEIRDALAKFVASYAPGAAARDEIGTVTEAGVPVTGGLWITVMYQGN